MNETTGVSSSGNVLLRWTKTTAGHEFNISFTGGIYLQGRRIGQFVALINRKLREGEIHDVELISTFRGIGIGRIVVALIEQEFRKHKLLKSYLVDVKASARGFWGSVGYNLEWEQKPEKYEWSKRL